MMKKMITLLMLTVMCCGISNAQTNEPIVLRPDNTGSNSSDNTSEQNGPQRSPVYTPLVHLTGNTLLFEESCIGCQMQILQDDEVEYSFYVNENGMVVLPATLFGDYELRLYWGSIVFVGELLLEQ